MEIAARGFVFDVDVSGPADGPTAVLLHGFPENATMWAAVAARLHAAGVRTVAPNQRGYSPGARPSTVDAYGVGELTADVLSIMDGLGVPAAHVVGHDWGAVVAWGLAFAHPERVLTLTAVSVPHPAAMAAALRADDDQRGRSSYIALFREPGKAEEVLLADGAARLRAMVAESGAADRYADPMRAPGALTAALNWYRANDLTHGGRIGAITVPTTFVWSDGDTAIGRTAAEGCADHVSGDYRFVALPEVSHWIPDRAPDALADAILARIGGSAPTQ
jgi:pimeloyl-ACP methyl ester carboxylesterase